MKIKINKPTKRKLTEGLPAAVLPLAKRFGPKILKGLTSLFGGGGDDEAEEIGKEVAQQLTDKSEVQPLDVESKQLFHISGQLDGLAQIMQKVDASIAGLPQDTTDIGDDPEPEVPSASQEPAPKARVAKPREYKVVKELKRRVINNLRSLS